MAFRISNEELARHQALTTKFMNREGLAAFIYFNPASIFYLTNFAFISTERPLALIQTADNQKIAFIPRLELEHCRHDAQIDRIETYPDYPGLEHPLHGLARLIDDLGLAGAKLGAEADGSPGRFGYLGPRLSQVLPQAEVEVHSQLVVDLRKVKSDEEIKLIREAARWGAHAHRLLQDAVTPEATETEISINASRDAALDLMNTLGPEYDPKAWAPLGVMTGFRGQVGANSANPHAMLKNLTMRRGDGLITYTRPVVWGYFSEMERTLFVGRPSAEQTKFFNHMLAVRDIALDNLRPGRKCSDVDKPVMEYYARHGLSEYWRHHTGHCLGLETHEAPFLDVGDDRLIEPGMVFSIEPGLYLPGLGGFRHSDTVLVTEDGMEMLTVYPADLESCICGG